MLTKKGNMSQPKQRKDYVRKTQGRLVWTEQLHNKFLSAVSDLGILATPKLVALRMNIEGVTRERVSSHWQKFSQRFPGVLPTRNDRNSAKRRKTLLQKYATEISESCSSDSESQSTSNDSQSSESLSTEEVALILAHSLPMELAIH